jgi:phage baseplate assembly protein gpV
MPSTHKVHQLYERIARAHPEETWWKVVYTDDEITDGWFPVEAETEQEARAWWTEHSETEIEQIVPLNDAAQEVA